MSPEVSPARRVLAWCALLFAALTFTVSWWHWWTFQYSSFDLAFYVQALWLALRGQWQVSLLNVPLMGNHAEPIVFLLTPLFALWPHPMLFVAVQTLAFATMPFTAYRLGQRLELEPKAALLMALATIVTPAAFSIAIYEFHPEALAAPLLLLLIEARMAEWRGRFWLWFLAVLSVKENMAPLLVMFCGVFAVLEWKRGLRWQLAWNLLPAALAAAWLLYYGRVLSPALNAGNVDYLQLYEHLGGSPGDIVRKFFTEPHRLFGALRASLTQGNMLWALLLPLLLLPIFRPRWLLIAAPLLAQHLLSWRSSEWSLGAHYPAPLLPLFWMAAVEALRRLQAQTAVAAAVLVACVLAHLRFGETRAIAAQLPELGAVLERREWQARMIAEIPEQASVTAGLGFLSHLATRERLVSLHHILKGLKTLSTAAYVPPPPSEVVVIDYADTQTFNTVAGYYHPAMRVAGEGVVPSSDVLLHRYLRDFGWRVVARNSVTVLRREIVPPLPPVKEPSAQLLPDTRLIGMQVLKRDPGGMLIRMSWQLGEPPSGGPPREGRQKFPWLMLVASDGKQLYPLLRGACAIEARPVFFGTYTEDWTVIFPSSMHAGYHSFFAQFYDGVEAAWAKKLPPNDPTFTLTLIDLGGWEIQPGEFLAPAK